MGPLHRRGDRTQVVAYPNDNAAGLALGAIPLHLSLIFAINRHSTDSLFSKFLLLHTIYYQAKKKPEQAPELSSEALSRCCYGCRTIVTDTP